MIPSVFPIDGMYFTSTTFSDFRVHYHLSDLLLSGEVQQELANTLFFHVIE